IRSSVPSSCSIEAQTMVLFSRWRDVNGAWSNEQNLAGVLTGIPVCAQVPDSQIIQLFYRGTNNGLFSRWRNPNGTWSNEQSLKGVLSGDPTAALIPGTDILQVF